LGPFVEWLDPNGRRERLRPPRGLVQRGRVNRAD